MRVCCYIGTYRENCRNIWKVAGWFGAAAAADVDNYIHRDGTGALIGPKITRA
jgi:hypothetical protein